MATEHRISGDPAPSPEDVEYVARHAPEAITEALNRMAAEVDTRPGPFYSAAARRLLGRYEW